MKLERSTVDFPLWRKKVDKSLFEHNGTTIPMWACEMWGLPKMFGTVSSRLVPEAAVTITFRDRPYNGSVTIAPHGREQPPVSFPNLFARLIGSPTLRRISDELEGGKEKRIHKQDWKARTELPFEIGAANVLYLLLDSKAKLIYIGEARDMLPRLLQPHPTIPNWDYFRYDVLPSELAPHLVPLERMLIRYLAALLLSGRQVSMMSISEYRLANDKIDK